MWATDVTFSPSDLSGQGTSGTGSAISATKSTVTFACDKGYGTTEIRCYSGGKITISSPNTITAISFTFSGGRTGGLNTSYTELSTTSWEVNLTSQARIAECTVTYATASSDPSSSVAFANASPALDLKDAATYTQVATTADGYVDAGGSVTYSMTNNTAGASINTSTGVVTPTQAGSVTVQAEAAAVAGHFAASYASYTLTVTDTREWTVTCHIGNDNSNVNRISGATLSLDDPADICGKPFVGWSSTDNYTSPTWVDNTTKVTGNMELWAIFEVESGEYSYHLVEADQADWRGDYLIAYDSETFANGKASGTSGIGDASTVQDPKTKLSGNVVDATWGDEYYVTLEAKDDEDLSKGYVLKTQDGYYNYQTGNTNGIGGTSKNKATAANYPITVKYVSSAEINLELSSGPVFRYNTGSGFFRYYKSTSYASQGKVYLYKRIEDNAPVYSLCKTVTTPAVTSFGWATYITTEAIEFEANSAYVVTDASVSSGLTLAEVNKVPTGTPLLLKGAGAKTAILLDAAPAAPATNLLTVSDGSDLASGSYPYVLAKNGANACFKQWTGAMSSLTDHVMLVLNEEVSARAIFELDDDVTAIAAVKTQNGENGQFFNLAGQRVAQPTKGLYIVNGKKVIIK